MDGNLRKSRRIFSWLGRREVNKRRIIVGLKSDNYSREMLLRLLHFVVVRGDSVLAVHVQKSDDSFDPNMFHIHEDLCKSKQVDFEVKICSGSCHITELSHQVRITFATILAVGCSDKCPKNPTISKWLKALPPTCKLLIMDNGGKILCQEMGTSQEGSCSKVLQPSISSLSEPSTHDRSGTRPLIRKSSSMPSPSTASTSQQTTTAKPENNINISPKLFHRLAMLEAKGYGRHFTFEELNCATKNFGRNMLIGEGAHSLVYKAVLENGQAAAVRVLKTSQYSEELFFREVEILSGLRHDNIIQLIGFCCCKKMYAIVYNLLNSSLKQRVNQLKWSERMQLAVGVAKALEYLHSCNPPIVHKDVNSSNILLSEDGKPQLSEFGVATPTHQPSPPKKPIHVIGRSGYLAPEYVMYGKVDEKIDVYSYGVVLLELITGKAAFQTSPVSNQESLVPWARSLLHCGQYERLIDPNLKEDYNKDEMRTLMIAARLCLLHSSSRRPTMKTVRINSPCDKMS
ncbi:Serine/threonine protein kinase [Handroanthus impetiginosus]|uniref:Serine/threonine protein kinase n=1 Tax=Handroanthus impetiginosus TaxID=429701 RepID=A0A2G9I7J0_9LAMI|nr:Serine/threonine protein kinase [Handroanthus impetiginosus]